MREIIVIGAGGYIGSRLMDHFSMHNVDWVQGFDLGIFGKEKMDNVSRTVIKDVRDIPFSTYNHAVVVYLASFHREPDGCAQKEDWRNAYAELMVGFPLQIAKVAHQIIYTSSMRALTDTVSLYGETKARAERFLVTRPAARLFRFGTVWGDFSDRLPNRPNTALNFALSRGKFTGDTWSAFTTHIGDAVEILYKAAMVAATPGLSPIGVARADIANIVDMPVPLTAGEVRELLLGQHPSPVLQTQFRMERLAYMPRTEEALREDAIAAENLQLYYGLET
jgi:nucleoside-diphosphate-sugar epimerase